MPDTSGLLPSLAGLLRPQVMGNWLMPYLSAITPTYIEAILRGGLAGNHVAMHQLFDLIWDTDTEVQSCIAEYQEGVLSKKIVFSPYHEEDEEPTDSALEKYRLVSAALRGMRPDPAQDENDLRGTIKDLLAARFHGQSVLEIDWYDTYGSEDLNLVDFSGAQALFPRSTYWVNPMSYSWDATGRLGLRVRPEEIRDLTQNAKKAKMSAMGIGELMTPDMPSRAMIIELPEDKFLVGVDKTKTGSIWSASSLRSVAWWWLAKNFCGDYLMKNAELFGVPFRKASYEPTVPENLKAEVRQLLQAMGSTGWALLPQGITMEFDKSVQSGTQSPAAFLFNLANAEIRKVILRQTMTGGAHDTLGKGGGKAFGETEKDVKSSCINAGATYVEGVFNRQFISYILKRNYGDTSESPTMTLQDDKVGGLEDAQRDQILVTLFDVGEDAMRRKYDLPKPTEDEKLCGQDTGTMGADRQNQLELQKTQVAERAKAEAAQRAQDSRQDLGQQTEEQQQMAAKRAREIQAANTGDIASALGDTIDPVIKRLKAINAITDPETKKGMLEKLLKDLPAVAKALKHDDKLAQKLTAAGVLQFVKGLKQQSTTKALNK